MHIYVNVYNGRLFAAEKQSYKETELNFLLYYYCISCSY
jgi:hypothetical protein